MASQMPRFAHPWWRTYDKPLGGYRDSAGFVNRLPLRLESTEMIIFGTVDAGKMWAEYDDEDFIPILVGGKAVVSVWLNNFTDTDCGGAYLETWYNTFVTRRDQGQVSLPMESPFSVIIEHERAQNFLQRVVCSDAPGNPGAALKAITGGREIFGFPKHPVPGTINFAYEETDGKKVGWQFDCSHQGKHSVSVRCALPETDPNHVVVPIDVVAPMDLVIGAPRMGGTHKNHNGSHPTYFGQAIYANQATTLWDSKTDSFELGDDEHYAQPLKRWNFVPLVKGHMPDFKTAAFQPVGWISGEEAQAAIAQHETLHKAGQKLGSIQTPWAKL